MSMHRHPYFSQEAESIWSGVPREEARPLVDTPEDAFLAKFPGTQELLDGWQRTNLREELVEEDEDADETPVQDAAVDAKSIDVVLQKHRGGYRVWVDGRLAEEPVLDQEQRSVYRLPAFDAYYRHLSSDGTRQRGVVTPVNFSVLLEDGERPPERVMLNVRQLRRVDGKVVQKDLLSEDELGFTNASGLAGECRTMPYPCSYRQKPFVAIRDVGAQLAKNAKSQATFFKRLLMIVGGYAIRLGTSWAFPTDEISDVEILSREFGGDFSELFSYGVPLLATFGLSVGSLIDWTLALGLTQSVWSLTSFLATIHAQTNSDSVQPDTSMKLFGLFGGRGVEAILRRGYEFWLPQGLLWAGSRVLESRPRPEMKSVRFTVVDLADSLKTILATDPTCVTALEYKERVLMHWMLEPTLESEGMMRRFFRRVASTAGEILLEQPTLFPKSGPAVPNGFNENILRKHTVDIEYELVVMDTELCEPTPLAWTFGGDGVSMTRGGYLASGVIEDDELLRKTIEDARKIVIDKRNSWRLLHCIFGIPFRFLNVETVNRYASRYNDPLLVSCRDRFLKGLDRVENEICNVLSNRLLVESKRREGMNVLENRDGVVSVCRLLPQRLPQTSLQVPSPALPIGADVRYDTAAAAQEAEEILEDQSASPVSSSKDGSLAVQSAGRAHKAANVCFKDFLRLWQKGRARPAIRQFFSHAEEKSAISFLEQALNGTPLNAVMRRVDQSHMPSVYSHPSDVAIATEEAARLRSAKALDIIRMVDPHGLYSQDSSICSTVALLLALVELFCDAQLDRSQMTASMGIVFSTTAMFDRNFEHGMELLATLFPRGQMSKCAYLHDRDPAFYALPGGRFLRALTIHLVDTGRLTNALTIDEQDDASLVPLSQTCREYTSLFRYSKTAPELLEAYSAPAQVFKLLWQANNDARRVKKIFQTVPLPVAFGSVLTDVTLATNGAALRRMALRTLGRVKAMRTFATAALAAPDARRLAVALARALADPVLRRMQPGEYDVFLDAVRAGDDDRGTDFDDAPDSASQISELMRKRNLKHSLAIGEFYDGTYDVLTMDDPQDLFRTSLEEATLGRSSPSAKFLFPFACGEWKMPKENAPVFQFNFETVPVSLAAFRAALDQQLADGAAPTFMAEIRDVFERRSAYENPFVVELLRAQQELAQPPAPAPLPVAKIFMSNPNSQYQAYEDDDADDALDGTQTPYELLENGVQSNSAPPPGGDGANVCIWNAERVVQAVYCLIGEFGHEKGYAVNVGLPVEWRASESERVARADNVQRIQEELQRHEDSAPAVVAAYISDAWDAVLQLLTGRVTALRGAPQQPPAGGDAAAAGAVPIGVSAGADTGVLSPVVPVLLAPGQVQDRPIPVLRGGTPVDVIDDTLFVDDRNRTLFGDLGIGPDALDEIDYDVDYDDDDERETVVVAPGDDGAEPPPLVDGAETPEPVPEPSPEPAPGEPDAEGTGTDVPERPEALNPSNFTIDSLPSASTIFEMIFALRASAVALSYVKSRLRRALARVSRWNGRRRELQGELAAARVANAAWEANVAAQTGRVASYSLMQAYVYTSMAQVMIKQVAGDVVNLKVDPARQQEILADPAVAASVQDSIDRIRAGVDASIANGIRWMDLGEIAHISDLVCRE